MLFTNDDDLRRTQKGDGRWNPPVALTPDQARREHIENEREIRAHQRLREFAFLLFVLPPLIGLVLFVVQWLAALLAAHMAAVR